MGNALFVDLSVFQPEQIDWQAYKRWSASGDGISRVALRSSYGTGFTDQHYAIYRKGAQNAGIDVILHYHYCYPQVNAAQNEANWQRQVVGEIRANDLVVMDFEEGVPQANAAWALAWLEQQERNYGGKLPGIYASDNYIRTRLQDQRLARFPLWLANWQFNPDARPGCPPPWSSYAYLQYTDKATNIPGIAGTVDANVSLIQGEQHSMLDISQVANYFEATNDPRRWHCKDAAHNFDIAYAILDFYRQENGLTRYGLPCSGEISLRKGNAVIQRFERGSIIYDPDRLIDTPPGAVGPCYAAHIDGFYDMAAQLDVANATIADLRALLAADKSTETDLHTQISELTQQLTDEKAAESELQTKISALQDQLSNAAPIDKQAISALLQALQPYVALAEQLKKVA